MLFADNRFYGEYTGLNNNYLVSVKSDALHIYNKETGCATKYEMSDSIPAQLFVPYTYTDSIVSGDVLYLNKHE